MKRLVISAMLALVPLAGAAAPLAAQSYQDQQRWDAAQARWDDAQARYQDELGRYNAERDRYYAARNADRRYREAPPPPPGSYDNPYATDYDAAHYYRDEPDAPPRVLSSNDQVYRGSDGRYYCKRSDGTTGLIVGAAAGGILGNVIDGGRHRVGGTLIGGALGALLGKSVDQNSDIRCR